MATAELAAALPALIAVLLAAVWVLTAVSAQERCVDAARVGARAAARGESDPVVRRWAIAIAPRGAEVTVTRTAGTVRVDVRAAMHPAGSIGGLLPAVSLEASVVGPAEPDLGTGVATGEPVVGGTGGGIGGVGRG
ncbi:MAG: TadE family type IV pilus minor pilin [Frankia sp.]